MSSEDVLLAPPRGMRDFYPEDMALRDAIFQAWRTAASSFGFLPYDACVVENLDLLKRKAGEEIVEQIYSFKDKSGRDLALRPEITPTLARMVAARLGALKLPLKWFTIAQCFRYERMSRGRKREHYQWNVDIIGENSVSAEAEVIACAVSALLAMGLKRSDFRVHFSSRALLGEMLAALGIRQEHHAATFLALDKRGKVDDAEMTRLLADSGLAPADIEKVFGLLSVSTADEATSRIAPDSNASRRIRELLAIMEAYGMGDVMQFDISVVRGLTYYTGIVFEAFDSARKFRAIFGGGRYDNLLRDIGGEAASGVGLGFGDVVVGEVLTDLGLAPARAGGARTAVGYMTDEQRPLAVRVAAALRGGGKQTDLSLSSEKPRNFFSRAGSGAFAEAVYLGPDDVARGSIRIKDLASRAEREVSLKELLP
jgi:histidyl-tRNA synthetase